MSEAVAYVMELRKQHKVSQSVLAEHLGVSKNTVYNIENGKGEYSVGQFLKALDLFGMTFCVVPKGVTKRLKS